MKLRIFISIVSILLSLKVLGQEWIGNRFTLDTIIKVDSKVKPKNVNLLKCKIIDKTFYFLEQLAFQNEENDNNAVIFGISLNNYEQHEISLPYPFENNSSKRGKKSLWIYDFDINGNYILIATQNELITYRQSGDEYEVVSISENHKNLCMTYLYGNVVNYFEEDHDKGYVWYQRGIEGDSVKLVREIEYAAPHIVQIQPNRYIFHNQKNVFFLSTRFPYADVYSLDGDYQARINFNISEWKEFEDSYIEKVSSIPYGIERIYAVKDDLFSYSYPKSVYPFNEDYVLFYAHYDSIIGKSVLQYAIQDYEQTKYFNRFNHEDSVYVAAQFPFDLFQPAFDKGNTSDDEYLVQLTYYTNVSCNGLNNERYKDLVNEYFKDNDLQLSYKIMKYKPQKRILKSFKENDSVYESFDKDKGYKSICILHNGLECSGCVKTIYRLLDSKECDLRIKQVYFSELNTLQIKEVSNDIKMSMKRDFEICAIDTMNVIKDRITKFNGADFPCIVFGKADSIMSIFPISEIFLNSITTEFNKKFLDELDTFCEDNE